MKHHNNRLTSLKRKCAFTLAEVLITLGIIGVVAAMTLPSVIQNYRNHSVEAKLKKFYSTFNQAVLRSIADNGDIEIWFEDSSVFLTEDENGKLSSPGLEWFNRYIGKYMNIVEVKKSVINTPLFQLSDGTSFAFLNEGTIRDIVFYTSEERNCYNGDYSPEKYRAMRGICAFTFLFNPLSQAKVQKNKFLEPYTSGWNGTEQQLYSNCEDEGGFCTKLIQNNGWKIPKDYPKKVR